jgi:hypothetical protein
VGLLERYARLVDLLGEELRAVYGTRLVSVAVYGSVGRGTPRADSDVDVLIVVRALPRGRFARVREYLPVERRLAADLASASSGGGPIAISPVFKTPEEVEHGSPLFLDMVEDARIVHDPEGFLVGYLDRLRARLLELGARRIWLGNAWYWDLKPDLKPGEIIHL